MKLYTYRAFGKEGAALEGSLEAQSRADLRLKIQNMGYSLISCSRSYQDLYSFSFKRFGAPKVRDLKNFWLHLGHFAKAGIPLKEALEDLTKSQDNHILRKTLLGVEKSVQSGALFSQALAPHPKIFDLVVISLVQAGEKTGCLTSSLAQILQYLRWKEEIQEKIFKALRYPLIMGIFLVLTLIVLVNSLVPELLNFVLSFKSTLPFSTLLLIRISHLVRTYGLLFVMGGGTILIFLHIFLKKHPRGKVLKSHLWDNLPLIGHLRYKIALSHFFHLFSVLWSGGIDIFQIISVAQDSITSQKMKRALHVVESAIREGQTLSEAFEQAKLFPSLVIRMINVGEKTSTLSSNLLAIKEHTEDTLKREIDTLLSLIEPLILLILGSIMGWIVVAVFLPLYETLVIVE